MMRFRGIACSFALGLTAATASAADAVGKPLPAEVRFNRDVQPILAENCYSCHGPDASKRKADLRLDTRDGLFAAIKDRLPVAAGHPENSEILRRITAADPDERMPDPKSNKKLTDREIALLKKWIEQGAKWQGHWAFAAPVRPPVPGASDKAWVRNPIDAFVLARLDEEGLKHAAEADKPTLLRRLTLDLTGLPPTLAEVDAFVADRSPDAYEKQVDRLLNDPHFGERMALDWLDAARFADTHGYHIDSGRDMTRWRDWVIAAFNRDEPFDQFAIEQLGGDLLPNPTLDQRIATGFNRNSMINFEGGAIPEEYLTAYLIDRVSTTSTVFLGLTMNCCQCHDHKYDPFTQKDFYQLYAFFNGVPENGLDGRQGNAVPVLKAPTNEQKSKLEQLASTQKDLEAKLTEPRPETDAAQREWEKTIAAEAPAAWTAATATEMKSVGGAKFEPQPDGSVLVTGPNPPKDVYTLQIPADATATAFRLETLPDDSLRARGPGRSENGNFVLTAVHVSARTGESAQKAVKLRTASADFSQNGFPITNVLDPSAHAGWAIYPEAGKAHQAIFEFAEPVNAGDTISISLEFNSQFSQHQVGRFRVSLTSSRTPQGKDAIPGNIRTILAIEPEKRGEPQAAELRTFYRTEFDPRTRSVAAQLAEVRKQREAVEGAEPTTMVMQEMAQPRDTFILVRGQYDRHGDKVSADVPASLPPLRPGEPHNRLGLGRWLVSPENPLTARVTVNRLWQTFFGTGIVKTSEDFGTQGEPPTHPELLDWLAVQFREGDASTPAWDVKRMVRLMVTSAAYRQSSVVSPDLYARDPENRLYARGPRFRLPAEFIRDQALAVSGLLDDRIGGASVSPYQPAGLWEELMSRSDGANWTAQTYVQSHGPDLYRRSMYTFWKRTSPPAALSTFDAPDRETCTVRRSRTNTPLQALVLWNDPTYVEASRKLAERILTRGGAGTDERIAFAFRLVAARDPSADETSVLRRLYEKQRAAFDNDPAAAEKLLKVGESPRDEKLSTPDLAAWTIVSSAILNTDEAVTKG